MKLKRNLAARRQFVRPMTAARVTIISGGCNDENRLPTMPKTPAEGLARRLIFPRHGLDSSFRRTRFEHCNLPTWQTADRFHPFRRGAETRRATVLAAGRQTRR